MIDTDSEIADEGHPKYPSRSCSFPFPLRHTRRHLFEVSMRRLLSGSALAVSLSALVPLAIPAVSYAAPPEEGGDEIIEDGEDELVLDDEMEAEPETPPEGSGDTSFLDDDPEEKASTEVGTGSASAEGEGGIDAPDESTQEKIDEEMITVVQRQAFLNVYKKDDGKTVRRFEIQPQVGLSINDAFVRHYAVGAELDFWLTNRMAIGLTGTAFFGQRTPAYERVRFQNGLLLTANRYVWQGSLNFLYEPFYGKIAVFNRALMHWEAFTQIGGGIIQTQTIPRFEAIHEPFNNFQPQGNFAIGARFYVDGLDFMSFNLNVRTWVFPDVYEPPNRGPATDPDMMGNAVDNPNLDDPANAKAEGVTRLAFNSVVFFGVSFYLPPRFNYSTRR